MNSSNMDFPTRNQRFFMVLRGGTGANGCFCIFWVLSFFVDRNVLGPRLLG